MQSQLDDVKQGMSLMNQVPLSRRVNNAYSSEQDVCHVARHM